MAGASRFRNAVAMNRAMALGGRLTDRSCRVWPSDQMMETPKQEAAFFPGLMVTCGVGIPRNNKPITNPTLAMEVLSRSTRDYDLTTKLRRYQRVPSLRHIIFIDSEAIGVQLYSRGENELWPGTPLPYTECGQTLDLAALGVTLSLEEIYEGLNFSLSAE